MGYSCTQDADHMLGLIRHTYSNGKYSNGLVIGKETYFFERGREQEDGAITGKLWLNLPGDYAKPVGSFKIAADGEIVRFPRITAKEREELHNSFRDLQARNPMLLRSWSHGVL